MTAPQEQRGSGLKSLDAYVAYLALQHAQDQEALAASLALALFPLWTIQKFTELDSSTPLWLSSALPVVKTAYLQSQRVTAVYAENVRFASLPTEDPLPIRLPDVELPTGIPAGRFQLPDLGSSPESLADQLEQDVIEFDDFPVSDVAKTLAIQGNYEIKAQMPGDQDELMYNGLKNSSGGAIRQAMNGGRNASDHIVQMDRRVIGYARHTDANPCYFCALLASQGAIYKITSFAKGGRRKPGGGLTKADSDFKPPKNAPDVPANYVNIAKVHDHCRCTLRPVYSKAQGMDAAAKFYRKQWDDLVDKNKWKTNDELIQMWRESYKIYQPPEADVSVLRNQLQGRRSGLVQAGFSLDSPQVKWADQHLNLLAS